MDPSTYRFRRPSPRARCSRCLDARLRSTFFTLFCTRGCPKIVTSTTFSVLTVSTLSRTWFIHSSSGITPLSGPTQEKRESEGRRGGSAGGARFEGHAVGGGKSGSGHPGAPRGPGAGDCSELPCRASLRLQGPRPPAHPRSLTKDQVSQPGLQVKHQGVSQLLHRKPPGPGANPRQWERRPQQRVQGRGGRPGAPRGRSTRLVHHAGPAARARSSGSR